MGSTVSDLICVSALACILGSCREAPARLDFGSATFEAERRPDILELSAGSETAVIEFCNLEHGEAALTAGCKQKDRALDDSLRGFRVMMMGNVPWSPPFAELPDGAPSPETKPLVPAGMNENFDFKGGSGSSNWYAVSRLRAFGDEAAPILTTDQNWPLVVCQAGEPSRNCTVAFIVDGVFVEARWHHYGRVDQAEIWRISTGIDSKLRTFLDPPS